MINNGAGIPIVALDIDGTLGDYHKHFLQFATGWFGRSMPDASGAIPGSPLWEYMKISIEEYRLCKLAYRQGGMKRTLPCYPGAAGLTAKIRAAGAEVWICTTRPYLRLDNIDPDTREWLRRNDIQYDGVLFDKIDEKYSKYAELSRQVGDRVCAIVDDLPECLEVAAEAFDAEFVNLLLRDQPYNQYTSAWEVVENCDEMWTYIQPAIDAWIRDYNA